MSEAHLPVLKPNLLLWKPWLLEYKRMLPGVGDWDNGMNGGKKG